MLHKLLSHRQLITRPTNMLLLRNSMNTMKGVDILSSELVKGADKKTTITAFGDKSFLINRVLVRQSVVLLPNSFLLWKPRSFEEITVDSLTIFELIKPTIEVLFIGCGETMPQRLPTKIFDYFKRKGIVVEASNTINAASTFNVLNGEGRNVAAALLTLQPIDDEEIKYKKMFPEKFGSGD